MRDALEIRIGVCTDEKDSLIRNYHDSIVNLTDDHMLKGYVKNMIKSGLLDDAADFIKEIILNKYDLQEDGEPGDDGLDITVYVGDHDGRLSYTVFVMGVMYENDIRKLIESSILEESIEESKKDFLEYISQPKEIIQKQYSKEAMEQIKQDLIKFISAKLDSAKLQC